jgi:hypothetical protein
MYSDGHERWAKRGNAQLNPFLDAGTSAARNTVRGPNLTLTLMVF